MALLLVWGIVKRLRKLFKDQRFRFIFAGGANTAFSTVIFSALVLLFGQTVPAAIDVAIAWIVAIVAFFFVYRCWVFRAPGKICVDFVRFCGVNSAGLLFNFSVVAVLVDGVGLPAIPIQVCVTIMVAMFNYFAHKYFSFRRC